ncbi:hypothetical protein [Niveibacterium sp. SC-1]|uniref:hypothetical protein n=1 Tax=Niveibacterium sp. SC-1 TaxID=3135646 RepID=UPI00311F1A9D
MSDSQKTEQDHPDPGSDSDEAQSPPFHEGFINGFIPQTKLPPPPTLTGADVQALLRSARDALRQGARLAPDQQAWITWVLDVLADGTGVRGSPKHDEFQLVLRLLRDPRWTQAVRQTRDAIRIMEGKLHPPPSDTSEQKALTRARKRAGKPGTPGRPRKAK